MVQVTACCVAQRFVLLASPKDVALVSLFILHLSIALVFRRNHSSPAKGPFAPCIKAPAVSRNII